MARQRLYAHPNRPINRRTTPNSGGQYGFFPAAGTNYSVGDEPVLAQRLNALGKALKLHLIGISGYRTPAHSVAVGGFPNDPHTQGRASDTPGVEGVPERVLRTFGLTRPFGGAKEADHIQRLAGAAPRPTSTASPASGPAQWLKQAGWPAALIPTMVAIGGAESGWKVDATHHNSNNTEDDGWLQINSVHGYDRQQLRSDPVYTAKAALAIYKKQGLGAWTTYSSGAYKKFLHMTPRVRSFPGGQSATAPGVTRPGGNAPGSSGPDITQVLTEWSQGQGASGSGSDAQFTSFDPSISGQDIGLFGGIPLLLNPLDLYKNLSGSVNSAVDFLKILAWIINPVNIMRMVEFLVGLAFMVFGLQAFLQAYGEQKEGFITSENALSRSGLGRVSREVASAVRTTVPAGRAASASRAATSTKSAKSGKRRRVRPEAAPHRTRRQALRLRYDREKQVSQRRASARRQGE